MTHQHGAQRYYRLADGRKIGTIAVGSIFYIQDWHKPLGLPRYAPMIRREPWIVEAWLPRIYALTGRAMRGGHLAQVRSLRTGRRETVSDWILLQCEELGLTR